LVWFKSKNKLTMLETFKFNLLNNWTIMRWIRFALSIIILVQAIQLHDALFGVLGLFFLYQAVSNTGCCATSNCAAPIHTTKNNSDIEFEEVKNK